MKSDILFIGYKLCMEDSSFFYKKLHLTISDKYPMHCTLIYANRTEKQAHDLGMTLDEWEEDIKNKVHVYIPTTATIRDIVWWEGHDKEGYCVALLGFPDAVIVNHKLSACGLQSDYDTYVPHMTLANPISEEKAQQLKDILLPIIRGKKLIFDGLIYERLQDN